MAGIRFFLFATVVCISQSLQKSNEFSGSVKRGRDTTGLDHCYGRHLTFD